MAFFTEINRLKAELDALRPLAPEQEQRILQKFRLEWNYNSNAIEGNSLTLGETRSLLLHGLTAAGKPMRDHLDIKGHNEAVLWLEDFVRDGRPLTEQFIRGMHEVLLGEAYRVNAQTADGQPTSKLIQPGRYKTSPNNVLTATGEMFYFASVEETPARMMDLVDWYRQEEAAPTMPPVALAAEFHYRFVRIHPFDDGNGRMARLLMNLILLRYGYPMTVIKNDDRNRYLAALSEADAGDPEPFLRFIIDNVEAGLRLMIRAAKGESIDEPDDLDKKLALLKKQLFGGAEDRTRLYWNQKTQYDFYYNCLEKWLHDLVDQSVKFDFAFTSKQFRFGFIDADNQTELGAFRMSSELAGVLNVIQMQINQPRLLYGVRFLICWEVFKKEGPFLDMSVALQFSFSKGDFRVSYEILPFIPDKIEPWHPLFSSGEKLFKSVYHSTYDLAQIHALNHQLATKVYDFIAAKVTEADSTLS